MDQSSFHSLEPQPARNLGRAVGGRSGLSSRLDRDAQTLLSSGPGKKGGHDLGPCSIL